MPALLAPKGRMASPFLYKYDISQLQQLVGDLPTLGEIFRKIEDVSEAEAVGDHDERYYHAAKAWLSHCHEGREAANFAYEYAWYNP